MKLNAVNVVEYVDDTITAIHSFTDDAEGNDEAEGLFTQIAKENGFELESIEAALDDGHMERGTWQLFIVHNS